VSLITIDQAKAHLRIDTVSASPPDAAEVDLTLKMEAAEAIILDYLKVPVTSPPLWTDETDVPPLVSAAILLQLGELYRFRGDDDGKADREPSGSLSPLVEGMLRRYRDPALA
jgi:hypothetical protein